MTGFMTIMTGFMVRDVRLCGVPHHEQKDLVLKEHRRRAARMSAR
jgi:hypothetical protein